MSFFEIVTPACVRVVEAERLDRVEHRRQRVRAVAVGQAEDEAVGVRLRQRLVDELEVLELAVGVADELAELRGRPPS